jgi:hypothetical protein
VASRLLFKLQGKVAWCRICAVNAQLKRLHLLVHGAQFLEAAFACIVCKRCLCPPQDVPQALRLCAHRYELLPQVMILLGNSAQALRCFLHHQAELC